MNIARISISYDRGVARNDEKLLKDALGLEVKKIEAGEQPKASAGDRVLRGLGTHYRTASDAELVKLRDQEAKKIYSSWRAQFLSTPIDGVYVIPRAGAAKDFAAAIETRADIKVRVTEYELVSPQGLEEVELADWAGRVKSQLKSVPLGRGHEADEDGLRALIALSNCPVLSKDTGARIREMVESVRAEKIDKLELKRQIEVLDIEIEQGPLISPRRASPTLV